MNIFLFFDLYVDFSNCTDQSALSLHVNSAPKLYLYLFTYRYQPLVGHSKQADEFEKHCCTIKSKVSLLNL